MVLLRAGNNLIASWVFFYKNFQPVDNLIFCAGGNILMPGPRGLGSLTGALNECQTGQTTLPTILFESAYSY